jgi:hypothetical protein
MRKVLYSMLIAVGVSACVESDIESPSAKSLSPSTIADPMTAVGQGNDEDARQITALAKTPITQAEFDQIIANTPPGQPIVIKRRSGYGLEIGQLYAPAVHPELLTFEFVECEFEEGIFVQNTFQAVMNIRRCIMRTVTLQAGGVVQMMQIKRSKIQQLMTMESSRCNDLTLIGTKIPEIINDNGGDSQCFRFMHFQ